MYRGWMVTVAQYTQLFDVLQGCRVRLINSPEQYAHCYWLPLFMQELQNTRRKRLGRRKKSLQ